MSIRFCLSLLDFLQILGRSDAELFLKALAEVDCAVDAYLERDFRNVVFPFQQHLFGKLHLDFTDVFVG